MAGFSLLALLDDITSVLDDVAVMAKVAARKTAGVLGDDLALTAQQVFGVRAKRELPVILGVAKGSLVNKLILIPLALILSAFWPQLIGPLLTLGGAYLCAEGGEKFFGWLGRKPKAKNPSDQAASAAEAAEALADLSPDPTDAELAALEKKKIGGAIKTDFVLSTEIIVIALGSLPQDLTLAFKAALLVVVGLAMTVGVYGVVALIVKLDDFGYWLLQKSSQRKIFRVVGAGLIQAAPWLMKFLTLVGTAAMFLVGGGILIHNLPFIGQILKTTPVWEPLVSALFGLLAGAILSPIVLGLHALAKKVKRPKSGN
jgi:predicted DNA repair protein MutK